jgi:glycerol transport system ATP-binding protein
MGAYHLVNAQVDGHSIVAKVDADLRCLTGAVEYFHFVTGRAFLFREAARCGSITALEGTYEGTDGA